MTTFATTLVSCSPEKVNVLFVVIAETTCNHNFSKEISQAILAAMVLAPNFDSVCRKPKIFPSFSRTQCSISLEFGLTPSGLFSLRLTFELSKSESLRDVSVTRIGDTFPTVFCRLYCKNFQRVISTMRGNPPLGCGRVFWLTAEAYVFWLLITCCLNACFYCIPDTSFIRCNMWPLTISTF